MFCFFEPNKSWFSNDWAEWVVEYHYWGEVICLGLILIGLLITAVLKIMMIIAEKKTNKATGSSDEFEGSLLRYLNVSESGRCYLLSGEWGVGKTFMLRKFLNKYYSKTNRNIYRISCFGLNTRKDIIDELSKVIGNADNSPMTVVLKVIKQIPVIGELLATLFKKSYGYGAVKKGSIFVFDDFERLSLRHEEKTDSQKTKENSDLLQNDDVVSVVNGVQITKVFDGVKSSLDKQIRTTDVEKYLSLTGVINEMVEVYGYKVIIVCNTDMLGEQFVSDILRSKLNCIEYRKQDSFIAIEDLIKGISDSFVLDDKDKQECVKKYLQYAMSSNVQLYLETKNLRILSNIIEAFIVTANLFKKEQLSNDFMDSLFSSIILFKLYFDLDKLERLYEETIGKNISLIDENFSNFFPDEEKEYRWLGVSVSGYWFLNSSKPLTDRLYSKWNSYPYIATEKKLVRWNYNIAEDKYDVFHVCYIVNHILDGTFTGKMELDWLELFRNWLVNSKVRKNKDVENMLIKMEKYLNAPNDKVYSNIFTAIYNATHCVKCPGDTKMINLYNAYMEKCGAGMKELMSGTGA